MSKRKKRRKSKKKVYPTKYIITLIILVIATIFITKHIFILHTDEDNIMNKTTEKNISFQYKENNDVIEIENPKVLKDSEGKNLNDYYSYTINNKSYNKIEYQIILTPVNMTTTDNIKIYLTDNKNRNLSDKKVKLYNDFPSTNHSKIIYTNSIEKRSREKQRLRIWLTEKGIDNINFKINIKVKSR